MPASEALRVSNQSIDVPAHGAAVATLIALMQRRSNARAGFGEGLALAGFAIALTASAVFVAIETAAVDPMLPLGLFRIRAFGDLDVQRAAYQYSPLRPDLCFQPLVFRMSSI
jgi:hypothetical protein